AVAVGHIQNASRRQHAVMRQETCRLTSHRRPGGAAIGASKDAVAFVSNADVDGLRRASRAAGPRVECFPNNAVGIAEVYVAGLLDISRDGGEACDSVPRRSKISTLPETITAACTEVNYVVLVWIDCEALAHGPTGHIASEFERQVGPLKGIAFIARSKNRTVHCGE